MIAMTWGIGGRGRTGSGVAVLTAIVLAGSSSARNGGACGSLLPVPSFGGFGVASVGVLDYDGDGDGDVIGSSTYSGLFAMRNDDGDLSTPVVIADVDFFGYFDFGDIDGDGQSDLVATHGGSAESVVSWFSYESGSGWSAQPIVLGGVKPSVADIDGDGDQDVATGSAWIENVDGGGLVWQSHDLQAPPRSLGDIDGDGDVDAYVGGGEWLMNLDGRGMQWQYVDWQGPAAFDERLGDFDGDGDLDFAHVSLNLIGWSENDGAQWITHVIDDLSSFRVGVADYDGDGDLDIFAVGDDSSAIPQLPFKTKVYANGMAEGEGWQPSLLSTSSESVTILGSGDIAGSGLPEIIQLGYGGLSFLLNDPVSPCVGEATLGCAGGGHLVVQGAPALGSLLTLALSGADPGAVVGVLAFNVGMPLVSWPDEPLSPVNCDWLVWSSQPGLILISTLMQGADLIHMSIPADPSISGLSLKAQWTVAPTSDSPWLVPGVSFSNIVELTIR